MTRRNLDDLGDLQRAVVETVWELGQATVRQVRDRLKRRKRHAYTTILSVMQKLEKAGWLRHRTEGRTYVYRVALTREQAGASSLRKFTQRVFRGNPLLLFQHLIESEDLSDTDLAEIRKMIDQKRREGRRNG